MSVHLVNNREANDLVNQAVVAIVSWKDPMPYIERVQELHPNHFFTLIFLLLAEVLGTGVDLTSDAIVNQVKTVKDIYDTHFVNDASSCGSTGSTGVDAHFLEQFSVFMKGVFQFAQGEMKLATETMELFIAESELGAGKRVTTNDSEHDDQVPIVVNSNVQELNRTLALLALKVNHDCYFYLGQSTDICQSVERVIDRVEAIYGRSIYGYALGMYAFGLEETYQFRKAETVGRQALEINRDDAWAVHAVAHVMEMEGRRSEGIQFLQEMELDWNVCASLACHLYWHWCLHLIELNRFSEAVAFFDREIEKRCRASGAMLDLVDGSSVLFRIAFEHGEMVGEQRWESMQRLWLPHLHDHILVFNDAHIAMSFGNKPSIVSQFVTSLEQYVTSGPKHQINHAITVSVGLTIIKSIVAYNEARYETTVDLLSPVILENKLALIGGSHAQRDLFHLLLVNACLKCGRTQLASELIQERQATKPNSGQTERLWDKLQELKKQQE